MSSTGFPNVRGIVVRTAGTTFVHTKAAAPQSIRETALVRFSTSMRIMSAKLTVIGLVQETYMPSNGHHGQLAQLTTRSSPIREGVTFATSITGTADLTFPFETTCVLMGASRLATSKVVHASTTVPGPRT